MGELKGKKHKIFSFLRVTARILRCHKEERDKGMLAPFQMKTPLLSTLAYMGFGSSFFSLLV